jgi:4-diphosphocytidyl-2-C-methyl-D-erythritol kinase
MGQAGRLGAAVTTAATFADHHRSDRPVHLYAPAKLTLSLDVVGVRPDGMHELVAEMVTVDLCDELWVSAGGQGLHIDRDVGMPPPADNLVAKALRVLGRRASVRLRKQIPPGAGLGGGSADAAAILRWAGEPDPGVALRLGSDVPFCVAGGRAEVRGIGEVLRPLPHRDRRFLLLLPPFGVDTAAVYRRWDELRASGVDVAAGSEGNALTRAALEVEPRLAWWRDTLGAATGRVPVLAGSGSTWYVERDPSSETLGARTVAGDDGQPGQLVEVRTVPAGWAGHGTPKGGEGREEPISRLDAASGSP